MDDDCFQIRNRDQVMSKEYRKMAGKNHEDAPIMMIPQVWLWKMGNLLVVACSMAVPRPSFGIRFESCSSSDVFYRFEEEPSIALQIGLHIAHPIDIFGTGGETFKSPLHMFEMAVFSTLSDIQSYLDETPENQTIKEQKKLEQGFIHAISDIQSELDMIQSVLE
jgi:hypothetical protein